MRKIQKKTKIGISSDTFLIPSWSTVVLSSIVIRIEGTGFGRTDPTL